MANSPGPREQQLRQMRGAKTGAAKATFRGKDPSRELAEMTAAAIGHPPLNAPADAAAQPKEKPMATAKKKAKPSKTPRKAAGASKKVRAGRVEAKTKNPAGAPANGAGMVSKSGLVHQMLTSPDGATREELAKATGWPSVNLNVAAKRAGSEFKIAERDGRFRLIPVG